MAITDPQAGQTVRFLPDPDKPKAFIECEITAIGHRHAWNGGQRELTLTVSATNHNLCAYKGETMRRFEGDDQVTIVPPRQPRKKKTATHEAAETNASALSGGFPLVSVSAEMNIAAASHAPADAFAIAIELDRLHEIPANVAMSIRTYTARLQGDYPIDPAVIDALYQYFDAQSRLVPLAEQIGALFRKVHAKDLEREEAPRTGEQHWNL